MTANNRGIAMVTGASTGLGREFALSLAEKGFQLFLIARDAERLQSLTNLIESRSGVKCQFLNLDLAIPGSPKTLYEYCRTHQITPTIVINNAGFGVWGPFRSLDANRMSEMIQLNVGTLSEITRLFLPKMIENKRGFVLNIASTAAFLPGPWLATYYASKAFVLSLGEALSYELRGTGVSLTTYCPGPTRTEFFDRANMKHSRLKYMFFADARKCSDRALSAMFQGKTVAIDGMANNLIVTILKFLPRRLVVLISGLMNFGT